MVELDAEFIGINAYNGAKKAGFEITGKINRQDFGLTYTPLRKLADCLSQDIKLIANLDFTV
jgi:polyisoprenoid-binding protein YceI